MNRRLRIEKEKRKRSDAEAESGWRRGGVKEFGSKTMFRGMDRRGIPRFADSAWNDVCS
jgi:hypothetical protein